MLTKADKQKIIGEIAEQFKRQKVAIFSTIRGISVDKLQVLRRMVKKDNAEYRVAKKTLIERAAAESGLSVRKEELAGEIGIAFGYGEESSVAKTLTKFQKTYEGFHIFGGFLGAQKISEREVVALAKLPSRAMLLSELARALSGPMRSIAGVLQANIRSIAIVLQKVGDIKQSHS